MDAQRIHAIADFLDQLAGPRIRWRARLVFCFALGGRGMVQLWGGLGVVHLRHAFLHGDSKKGYQEWKAAFCLGARI